ncbi:MAG: tetratricopeptide repeat protein [Thermodesulfobacteriota bacterium]
MNVSKHSFWIIGAGIFWLLSGCADFDIRSGPAATELVRLVQKVQPAVVTVVTYDMNGAAADLGSGFFIDGKGHLITNHHVLKGAYGAEVKTFDGRKHPIELVVAENEDADIIKVRVAMAEKEFSWVQLSDQEPVIGERILVVGSPLGLEQTVSEGIVSAVRDLPVIGKVFQLSAPISPGSSGSPVVNMKGKVIGVVSFQTIMGQNLNFAVAGRGVRELKSAEKAQSLSEWTYGFAGKTPRLAEELCKRGFAFSIRGEYKEALNFYKEAAEKSPDDAAAWYGLGACYIGLDDTEAAISAFQQAVRADPRNPTPYYNLGRYYGMLERYEEAVQAYKKAVAVDPDHALSYFDLGIIYSKREEYDAGEKAFKEVLRIEPMHALSYYFIGLGNSERGRYEAAIKSYQEVLKIDPESVPALYQLGIAFGKLGNSEDEIGSYKAAIRIDPDYAPPHFNMGIMYLKNGDKAAALGEYKILKGLNTEMADRLFDQIYRSP